MVQAWVGQKLVNVTFYEFLFMSNFINNEGDYWLTAYQLWALMSAHFLRSFFGDWYLQRFLSVVSV